MVAIEHRQKSTTINTDTTTNTSTGVLSPTSLTSTTSVSTTFSNSSATTTITSNQQQHQSQQQLEQKQDQEQQKQYPTKVTTTQKQQQLNTQNKKLILSKMSQQKSSDSLENKRQQQQQQAQEVGSIAKSAVSQRNVDIKMGKQSNADAASKELTKKVLKLDLTGKELEEYALKSPKSPITARLPHQSSLTSSVDVEDRKTLREALYQGIFHRHRRTIFAVGSFLRMLRSRNSQYNSIRSSSEGEDIDEVR